eukprot:gene13267-28095_t
MISSSVVHGMRSTLGKSIKLAKLSMSTSTIHNSLDRIVLSPLPRLYVYDHCPFCVRARLAFGLKNIKHNVIFLANDDVPTPTALVGKKIAPIFESVTDGFAMPESLDIIAKVDSDPKYGPIGHFKPLSGRADIKNWQSASAETNRILQRPRYMMTILPEFMQKEGKEAFVKKHPVPPFEKSEWASLTQTERWQQYTSSYEASLGLLEETNDALTDLDKLVYSDEYCTEGGLSLDDIDLWSRLRSLTIVKGLVWPTKLRSYMDKLAELGDVPLYDSMALGISNGILHHFLSVEIRRNPQSEVQIGHQLTMNNPLQLNTYKSSTPK